MELNMTLSGLELWKATGGFANEPHVHDDWYQVTLPVRGKCHLVQDRQTYPLEAGMGIVAHPRIEHFFEIGPDSTVIVIKFRNPPVFGFEIGRVQADFRPLQTFDPAEISRLFRGWNSTLLDDAPDPLHVQETELAVETYLRRMLLGQENGSPLATAATGNEVDMGAGMGAADGKLSEQPQPPFAQVGKFGDSHLRRVLDYIHSAYTSPMDIDSMAAVAHQSRYHFMRSFKALTGSTPYQYVLNLRVEEASRRLRLTDDSVTTISFGLGFSSVSQFYRAFQRVKGVTPMEYRSRM